MKRITTTGHFVKVCGKKVKIGILGKKGNAIIHENGNIHGVFAFVQWFHRGAAMELIAYNTISNTISGARKEMEKWMQELQYPEFNETSKLIRVIQI